MHGTQKAIGESAGYAQSSQRECGIQTKQLARVRVMHKVVDLVKNKLRKGISQLA